MLEPLAGSGAALVFAFKDSFMGLIYSQTILSIQLPITVFLQIYLNSSENVMGKNKNLLSTKLLLISIGVILAVLNIMLFASFIS